jgi:hypothetical protein
LPIQIQFSDIENPKNEKKTIPLITIVCQQLIIIFIASFTPYSLVLPTCLTLIHMGYGPLNFEEKLLKNS